MAMAIIDGHIVGGVDEPCVATQFNSEKSYAVGDYFLYNSTLYKVTEAFTGDFDSSKVAATTCADQLSLANSNLTELESEVTDLQNTFETVEFDHSVNMSVASATSGFTTIDTLDITEDGFISLIGYFDFNANSNGARGFAINLIRDSHTYTLHRNQVKPCDGWYTESAYGITLKAKAGDRITFSVLQNSGSTLTAYNHYAKFSRLNQN